jgi:hypothetical protein
MERTASDSRMRKTVTTTTTRRPAKEKRKEDEDIQQLQDAGSTPQRESELQSQQQQSEVSQITNVRELQSHKRDRDEQVPASSGNIKISGQEQRKVVTDEAALQTKNYRLAKELVCNESLLEL